MKYVLMIFRPPDTSSTWDLLGDGDGAALLQPAETATTVRVEDGHIVTADAPYAEEALVGFHPFDADDLDRAIEIAASIPAARLGGAVEIRPVVER